jgi:hypothetical protein
LKPRLNQCAARTLGVLLLALGVLPACGARAQETPPAADAPFERNSVIGQLNTAITFYASFDGQPIADMSVGRGAPTGNLNALEWIGGKRHRALRAKSNAIIYEAAGNINFENAGALAVWVALGERVDSAAPVQLGFATIRHRGSSLALARQGGIKNGESLMAIVGSNINTSTTRALVLSGSSKTWQPGEWHLLAMNWGSDYVELSLDGELFKRTTVNFPLFHHTDENGVMNFAGNGGAASPYDFDELFIFNRPLTAAEAALIYQSNS